MYWTLELASKLEDAPWPASKDELIDYAIRSGSPLEVIENLQEMEDEGEIYESIEDICLDDVVNTLTLDWEFVGWYTKKYSNDVNDLYNINQEKYQGYLN